MREERTIYCEGPECEAHQSTSRPPGNYPMGWIHVTEHLEGYNNSQYAFCSWDCTMKFAAQLPPPVVIPWNEALGEDAS